MTDKPKRTGVTDLTDDELLLFDFMFQWWVPLRALRREKYSFHMNCRYNHNLDDARLMATVERLVEVGWIAPKEEPDGIGPPCFSLTEAGGDLWQRERRPDWTTYVDESVCHVESRLTVLSPSEETANRYFDVGRSVGLWLVEGPVNRRIRMIDFDLLPWRTFKTVFAVVADNVADDFETRWDRYESQRTWWRNIGELDSITQA